MHCLANDFEKFGAAAIAKARIEDPLGYVKVCASLMPKELEVKGPLDELGEEQLAAAALTIRTILNAQSNRENTGGSGGAQPPEVLLSVSETS